MQVQEQMTTTQADRQAAEEAHAAQTSRLQADLARQQAQLEAEAAAAEQLHAASQSQEGRVGALQQVLEHFLDCICECVRRCNATMNKSLGAGGLLYNLVSGAPICFEVYPNKGGGAS